MFDLSGLARDIAQQLSSSAAQQLPDKREALSLSPCTKTSSLFDDFSCAQTFYVFGFDPRQYISILLLLLFPASIS